MVKQPTEKDIVSILKQHRSPSEAYAEVKKHYGAGHGLLVKEVALKHMLWKRKNTSKSASSAYPSASSSALPSAQASIYDSITPSALDSASTLASAYQQPMLNATADPMSEPLPIRMKNFKDMLSIMSKSGYPYDPALVALSMGYKDIATSVKGSNLAALMDPQLQNTNQVTLGRQNSNGPRLSALGNLGQTIRTVIDSVVEMKVVLPLVNQLTSDGILGNGRAPDKNEIQRMIEERVKQVQGDPEVKALKELVTKQIEEQRIRDLIEKNDGGSKGSDAEAEILKFKLQHMEQNHAKDAQTEQLRTFLTMTQNNGGNLTTLYEKFQQQDAEHERQREADRQRHELAIEQLRTNERNQYVQRLQALEAKLDKAGQSGDMLTQYSALRQIVKDEVDDLKRLGTEKGGVPELLANVASQFAAALTEFAKARGTVTSPVVNASKATPVRSMPPASVTGVCQWCQQQVTVPNVPQTNCPACGRILYPQVENHPAPQAPAIQTPQPPSAGTSVPVTPTPVIPVYDNPVQNGQIVRPRKPDEVVIA